MKTSFVSNLIVTLLILIFVGSFSLLFTEIVLAAASPEMAYPQNGQTLDLEGGYMFKVRPVEGASGYLLKLYQSGQTVYETESSNGEFGIWEDNPAHAKFHTGEVQAVIKAQVGSSWTDDKSIIITLKSRKSSSTTPLSAPQPSPTTASQSTPAPTTAPSPSASTQPTPTATPITTPTPIPSSSAVPSPSATPTSSATPTPTPTYTSNYHVKPYLVYPADKPTYPEYEAAVRSYMTELQNWYKTQVGKTFVMDDLQVVRSRENYLTLRCGSNPSASCINDPAKLEGNVGEYANQAIHNGVGRWDSQTAVLIFTAGAGGYAGANKYPSDTGWAIVGDWVLEPLSGRVNDWGISCKYSSWQCGMGVAKGTPAHELGHAFGLGHPDPSQYLGGHSIMIWHGDYPTYGFLPFEIEYLNNSPFFQTTEVVQAPAPVGIGTTNSTSEQNTQTPVTNATQPEESLLTTLENIVNQVISFVKAI